MIRVASMAVSRPAMGWLCRGLALLCLLPMALLRAEPLFDPFAAAAIEQKPGAQVPLDASFTDHDGRRVSLGDLLDGRPVVLAPVYFTCPNVCGAQLSSLFNLLSALPFEVGRDFDVIAFSFHPGETPADARAERDKLLARWPQLVGSPGVHFLTGPASSSAALAEAIGFRFRWDPEVEQYAHVSAIATLSPGGRLTRWLYGLGYQPDDLRLALTDAGEGKVGSLGDQLLLLCYHYNPRLGGYDNMVVAALQVGGSATVLALLGFIGVSLWRDRRRSDDHG